MRNPNTTALQTYFIGARTDSVHNTVMLALNKSTEKFEFITVHNDTMYSALTGGIDGYTILSTRCSLDAQTAMNRYGTEIREIIDNSEEVLDVFIMHVKVSVEQGEFDSFDEVQSDYQDLRHEQFQQTYPNFSQYSEEELQRMRIGNEYANKEVQKKFELFCQL